MMRSSATPLPLVAWLVALAATILALLAIGEPAHRWPPLEPADAWTWLDGLPPDVVGFLLVRTVALLAAGYLLVATLVALLASLTGRTLLLHAARRLALPAVRRLVARSVGLGLTASVVIGVNPTFAGAPSGPTAPPPTTAAPTAPSTTTSPAPSAGTPPRMVLLDETDAPTRSRPSTATQRLLDDEHGDAPPPTTGSPTSGAPTTVGPVPFAPPTTTDTDTVRPVGPSTVAPAPVVEPPSAPDTWTIAPGEHLWAVAADTLADRRAGLPPTNQEIADYLVPLIEHNRSGLADPNNPDLVYPGQVVVLPPVPPR